MSESSFLVSHFERQALSVFHDICVGDRFIGIGYQGAADGFDALDEQERIERGAEIMLAIVGSGLVDLYRTREDDSESVLSHAEAVALIKAEYAPGSAMLRAFADQNWHAWPNFNVVCRATDEALELFERGEWAAIRDRLAGASTDTAGP